MKLALAEAIAAVFSFFIELLTAIGIIDPSKAVKKLHKEVEKIEQLMSTKDIKDILLHYKNEDLPDFQYVKNLLYKSYCSVYRIEHLLDFTIEVFVQFNKADDVGRDELKLQNDLISQNVFRTIKEVLEITTDSQKFYNNSVITEKGQLYSRKRNQINDQLRKTGITDVLIKNEISNIANSSCNRNNIKDNQSALSLLDFSQKKNKVKIRKENVIIINDYLEYMRYLQQDLSFVFWMEYLE